MALEKTLTSIEGVIILTPNVFEDERGFFVETYHRDKYRELGIDKDFIQDNHSRSTKNVIRGMHYQLTKPQAKLVYVGHGKILDVAIDIRKDSSTFGKYVSVELSADNKKQLYIPEGFAHGFCVLSDYADVFYKCSDLYNPGDDYGVLWSDSDVGVEWGLKSPIVSSKDCKNPKLSKIPLAMLPE